MDPENPLIPYQFVSDRSIAETYTIRLGVVRRWATDGLVPSVKLPGSHDYMLSEPAVNAMLLGLVREAGKPSDSTDAFLEARTARDPGRLPCKTLYDEYVRWCGKAGIKPRTGHKFGRDLNGRNYLTEKAGGVAYKRGLRLLTAAESRPTLSITG